MDLKPFQELGGRFLLPLEEIKAKLNNIKAFIFDWDGVFNQGIKHGDLGSPYSEADSMGTNMLRFSYWLNFGQLPKAWIMSGANNPSAVQFAQREHFDGVLLKTKNKKLALEELISKSDFTSKEVCFFYDDILDLDMASICGLRMCVSRKSSPCFNNFVEKNNFADYVSGYTGGQHAVREICEMLISIIGNYDEVVKKRMAYFGEYEEYLLARNQVDTQL